MSVPAFDVAIVGAGIAGASLAAQVAGEARVLLLEAEDQPGYHSTGRSAAFWSESYGGPLIRPLTEASGHFIAAPPADFSGRPFVSPRGCIHLADADGEYALQQLETEFAGTSLALQRLDRAELEAVIPGIRPGWNSGLNEPSCQDIDVAALHAAYLKRARAQGAQLVTGARLKSAQFANGQWRLATTGGEFAAARLANAAGAWADAVAKLAGEPALGIQPNRRTLVQLRIDPPASPEMPLVIDALGRFYFKPEAGGRLWLSPHDETPCDPCDCAPEEIDVALAIDWLQKVVDWRVERVERKWAGLRSFAPDRLPVYGFSTSGRNFFWCAGQGGFGIQTAAAGACLAAGLLLGRPATGIAAAIDPAPYAPGRFA
ncbi:MAG: NAD(P)/FAD-dependent oxidoreductase [Sphingosinicella sp.]